MNEPISMKKYIASHFDDVSHLRNAYIDKKRTAKNLVSFKQLQNDLAKQRTVAVECEISGIFGIRLGCDGGPNLENGTSWRAESPGAALLSLIESFADKPAAPGDGRALIRSDGQETGSGTRFASPLFLILFSLLSLLLHLFATSSLSCTSPILFLCLLLSSLFDLLRLLQILFTKMSGH